MTQEQLLQTFSPYGLIDSVRLIADKECAFVNFVHIEDAIRAKEDILTLHNGRIGDTVVRIGYGKNDGPLPDSTVLQPTRALCKSPANVGNFVLLTVCLTSYGLHQGLAICLSR